MVAQERESAQREAAAPPPTTVAVTDSVDALLADWAAHDPTVDVSSVAVVTRLGRLRAHAEADMETALAAHDLTVADFAALSILRRAGAGGAPMGAMAEGLYLTAGTITPRVNRLVSKGLATTSSDAKDHRVRRVHLTDLGARTFEAAAPDHLARQRALLAPLTAAERQRLAELLRTLLAAAEARAAPIPARTA